jgi:hypothetical protein
MELATLLVTLFYLYGIIGCVFATWFVLRGVEQLDHVAKGISWITRLLFFPGSAALWPVLAWKLIYTSPENPANKH